MKKSKYILILIVLALAMFFVLKNKKVEQVAEPVVKETAEMPKPDVANITYVKFTIAKYASVIVAGIDKLAVYRSISEHAQGSVLGCGWYCSASCEYLRTNNTYTISDIYRNCIYQRASCCPVYENQRS